MIRMKNHLSNNHLRPVLTATIRRLALCALMIAAVSLLCPNASATLLRVSRMVGFSSGSLGTVGTAEGWAAGNANVTVTSGSGSLDGTALGLYPSGGDKVNLLYNATLNSLNTQNTWANATQFPPSAQTNLYYSFLYRFNTITNMSSISSNKIIQVNRIGSSSGVHFDVEAITNASGKIQLGVNKPGGTPAYAETNISVGDTIFIVVRQQIIPGSANDQIDLWINPPASSFGVDEGGIPTPDVSSGSGTEDNSGTGPGRMYVFGGVSANFDELRISVSSWADVTPCTTCCIPASFETGPTNTVVSEGIAATLYTTSISSSPTYQWQVSTNAGTNWNNVSSGQGGTSGVYTTPPLGTNDNTNRYRCVISVSCGGGSTATSVAGVVTVNPSVATPVGLLLDDQFADGYRTNAPIAISNSIWYASAAATLSLLDGTGTEMVGTPGAGGSRLWIGYFTDDTITNRPVHLAVGRALKATLVFKASNIVSNGSGSMRIGLFDYADGGTRVAGDGFGSGSTGNGSNVRGYMLTLDYGTNFSSDTPETISARSIISDNNLMGAAGDFVSLGSGPAGATLNGTPAFVSDTTYTLDLTVARSSATATIITASITGGGTNYTTIVTDATYAYPRFDAFAIRPNSLETTADSFTFSRFTVQVLQSALSVPPFNLTAIERLDASSVKLTWDSVANASYHVLSRDSLTSGGWATNATVAATSASTSYTNTGVGAINERYYRVVGLPYLP